MDSSIFSSLFMDYNWNNIKLLWFVFLVIYITISIFNNPRESLDGIFKGIGRAILAVLGMIVFSYITSFLFAIVSITSFAPKIFLPLTLIIFYDYFIELEPYIAPELFPQSQYNTMIIDFRLQFPSCFTMPKQPLALDIEEQLIKTKLYSPYEITKFLEIYCNNDYEYKKVLIPKAKRLSLNGEVSSLVSQEQLEKEENNEAWRVCRIFGRVCILITIIYFIM